MVTKKFCVLAAVAAASLARFAAAETLLVEFVSPDCGPCRQMRPVIAQLAQQGLAVREVDVTQQPAVAQQYGVDRWPTFIVLVDGRERARLVGKTSYAQLAEMVQKSQSMAAPGPPIATAVSNASAPQTFAAVPNAASPGDRIVQIDDGTPRRPAVTPRNPFAADASAEARSASPAAAAAATAAVSSPAGSSARLIASTVRLRVADPDGNSTGTGTIVDARGGKALVATCGHLFRTSAGKGAIEITLFVEGPNGAEVQRTVAGEMVDFDLERDLGFVCFHVDGPVSVTPIAPGGYALTPGAAVASVGCSHGANPTIQSSQITAVDRYQLPPNLSVAGQPVEGRSGGGLFDAQGQLIGVCNAADPQGNEGLFASVRSIHEKLDELGLAKVYQAPKTEDAAGGAATSAPAPLAMQQPERPLIRGQNPTPTPEADVPVPMPWAAPVAAESAAAAPVAAAPMAATPAAAAGPIEFELPASGADAPAAAAGPTLTPQEQAALEEIRRRGVDSEVICIIRPRTAEGSSDVIKLSHASPAFVEALSHSAQAASPANSSPAIAR